MSAHEHLEADWPNPKHWCFYCGINRGREPMEVFPEMSTGGLRALRCIDMRGCLARVAARREGRAAA